MKRRIVEPPETEEIIRRDGGEARRAVICAVSALLVTLAGAFTALWGLCFVVFHSPQSEDRDRMAAELEKNPVTAVFYDMVSGSGGDGDLDLSENAE